MNVNYSIKNLKLVYAMMLRDYWDKNGKEMGSIRAFLNFVFLEIPALLTERYCLLRFDYFIVGNDLIAALVISIILAERNKKLLFHNCMPDNQDYNLAISESQRLITQKDVGVIESMIGHPIGECRSFADLLIKLGQILSTVNKGTKKAFITKNVRVINSEATKLLHARYPNLCWTEFYREHESTKRYGFSPVQLRETKNTWYGNYQCAFSFKDAIILTKLNPSLSANFFVKPLDFAYMSARLSNDLVFTSDDRIADIKLLLKAIDKRG
jgi:hypothetical protein